MDKIWIVGYEDNKWWCSERTPDTRLNSPTYTHDWALKSAETEAKLLMMKYTLKNDMSKATMVSDGRIGFGLPYVDAPTYIDYNEPRKTPEQVWVIEAPTRYQAVKIAKKDFEKKLIK